MAIQKVNESDLYARNAGADLSGNLHYLAKVDTDADIILTAARADAALGVVFEAAVADKPVTVQTGGIGKVICGEAIAAGEQIGCGADGKAIDADTAGDYVIGIALGAGSTDEIISFQFARGRVHA